MKRVWLAKQGLGLSAFCIITTTVHAGMPVWSFSPNGSPQVTVSATGSAVVSYTITNNSKKPHRLVLSSKTPAGISQSAGPCVLAGKSPANPNPTCTLTLNINGSALPANDITGGPVLCQVNDNDTPNLSQCYQPSSGDTLVITRTTTPGATTLSASIAPTSILALSVNSSPLTGNKPSHRAICFSRRTTRRDKHYHSSHDMHGNISPQCDLHGYDYPGRICNVCLQHGHCANTGHDYSRCHQCWYVSNE